MDISIHHTTRYSYATPATHTVQHLRLTARDNAGQRIARWRVIGNGRDDLPVHTDAFGNIVRTLTMSEPHHELVVEVVGEVRTEDHAGILKGVDETMPAAMFSRTTALTAADNAIRDLATPIAPAVTKDAVDAAHQLMNRVRDAVAYVTGETDSDTTAAAALAAGAGVCQDHAHVMITAARLLGFPARYVSGYLAGEEVGEIYEASHAWAELFIDGLGWVGFDAANRVCPNERYVRIGCGLDYRGAAPIIGIRRGAGAESLTVEVAAMPMGEQNQSQDRRDLLERPNSS